MPSHGTFGFMIATRRWMILLCLMLAGEMIFSLPFHVPRFFRPTMLDVFGLSNTGLGDIFALYGFVAILAYFVGGPIADRFTPRVLIATSLVLTAAGGVYLAQIPNEQGLKYLFAYWGGSTILLFWSGLIRVTREWGGSLGQGRAFGVLDGGRGLVAALFSSLTATLFVVMLPAEPDSATLAQRTVALQAVIYCYSLCTFLVGILVWFLLPPGGPGQSSSPVWRKIGEVIKRPVVWMQGVIIICAYCGYKGLDNYGLYAEQVLGFSEVEANRFVSTAAYLRPIGAVGAGLLADRFLPSWVAGLSFLILVLTYLILASFEPANFINSLIIANLLLTFVTVFGLRGVYFALIEETQTPRSLTGTTAGLISVVGFTPDFFFNAVAGRILDESPGVEGFQNFFLMLVAFSVVGMLAILALSYLKRARKPVIQT